MSKTLQFRRNTTGNLSAVTGSIGELFVDTTKKTVVVMDGSTAGGTPLATESYVTTAVSNIVDAAPGALNTLNELAAALGDDENYASTITTALGLKAPAADPTFTGLVTMGQSTETLNTKTSATGTVVHDFSTGAIWYHSSVAANFTANFTNVPTTNNRAIVVSLIIVQGASAYIPNAVQIGGSAQTLNWAGGSAPTPTANKVEIVSFSLIRTGSAWTVLGNLASYG
jgi:hypothetical protein